MQKAHEFVCWWRVSDPVARRREFAVQLHASYVDGADEPSAAKLRFMRLEGLMLPVKSFEQTESTHGVPGMAADEVQSSWSKNLHLVMLAAVRTRTERLIVAQPLGTAELRQRGRPPTFHTGEDLVEPTKAIVRGWASPLGKPVEVAFEMKPAEMGPPKVCTVIGCARASRSRVLRGSAGVVLCDTHVAEQMCP